MFPRAIWGCRNGYKYVTLTPFGHPWMHTRMPLTWCRWNRGFGTVSLYLKDGPKGGRNGTPGNTEIAIIAPFGWLVATGSGPLRWSGGYPIRGIIWTMVLDLRRHAFRDRMDPLNVDTWVQGIAYRYLKDAFGGIWAPRWGPERGLNGSI